MDVSFVDQTALDRLDLGLSWGFRIVSSSHPFLFSSFHSRSRSPLLMRFNVTIPSVSFFLHMYITIVCSISCSLFQSTRPTQLLPSSSYPPLYYWYTYEISAARPPRTLTTVGGSQLLILPGAPATRTTS